MTNTEKRNRRRQRRTNTRLFANSILWTVENAICYGISRKTKRPCVYNNFAGTPTLYLAALVKAGKRIARLAEEAQTHLDKRYELQRQHKFLEMLGAFTYIDIPVRVVHFNRPADLLGEPN